MARLKPVDARDDAELDGLGITVLSRCVNLVRGMLKT